MSSDTPHTDTDQKKATAVTKKNSKLIALRIPNDSLSEIDAAVIDQDTDRSKFIRRAIKRALQKTA